MTIRTPQTQDIKALAILFNAYRVFYEKKPDIAGAEKFLHDRIKNNESMIFIAENSDSKLLGFVQLYPLFSSTRMQRLWLLNDLFVDKNFRGQGISLLLIERAKELCSETNACGLMLETAKSNDIGNNLYLRTGFSKDTEHNFYSWNTD